MKWKIQCIILLLIDCLSPQKNLFILIQMSLIQTQQIQLLTIFSTAEQKLQCNLQKILKKIKQHQQIIKQNTKDIKQHHQQKRIQVQLLHKQISDSKQSTSCKIEDLCVNIRSIIDQQQLHDNQLNETQSVIQKINIKINNLDDKYAGQISQKLYEIQLINKRIIEIIEQSKRTQNILLEKQNRSDSQATRRLIKQVQIKLQKSREQLKYMDFKLENMDLLSQRNQNCQKKQIEKIKQMETKLKQQIRMSKRHSQIQISQEMRRLAENSRSESPDIQKRLSRADSVEVAYKRDGWPSRQSNFVNQVTFKPQHQKLLNSLTQKFSRLEIGVLEIEQKIKNLEQTIEQKLKKSLNSNSNISQIFEKMNIIKPQLIKLWSKCDSLEEKTVFTDRKVEQKSKQISYIMDQLKQSHYSKINDRFKSLQTQLFGQFKEIKSRLETKMSIVDYEKTMKAYNDRFQGLVEQVLMKSDKLQVKKALLFLQSKIKEIILVISQEEQNEREALLTKKQIKCISCDKEVDKFMGIANNSKGNWDLLPGKQMSPENMGRFGMTNYGTMAKKIKRLEAKDLPILCKKSGKGLTRNSSQHLDPISKRDNL